MDQALDCPQFVPYLYLMYSLFAMTACLKPPTYRLSIIDGWFLLGKGDKRALFCQTTPTKGMGVNEQGETSATIG
jgi:hypothetical protein